MIATGGLLVAAFASGSAQAGVIKPDTTADQHGSNEGECSLREAVVAANEDSNFGGCKDRSGSDVIDLGAKTYRLTRSGSGEDNGARGDLDVIGTLKLRGAGMKKTAIDARSASDRHLGLQQDSVVGLSELTLENGSLDEFGGGAIQAQQSELEVNRVRIRRNVSPSGSGAIAGSSADLTIKNSVVEKNRATFAGGGITLTGGSLVLTKSAVINNRSGLFGGGIYPNNATVRITKSLIANNRSEQEGGGIVALAGTVEVTQSRIIGNTASNGGGVHTQSADVEIRASELSDNRAMGGGGALNLIGSPLVEIENSTFSGNRARESGGGVRVAGSSSEIFMNNATLTRNVADSDESRGRQRRRHLRRGWHRGVRELDRCGQLGWRRVDR